MDIEEHHNNALHLVGQAVGQASRLSFAEGEERLACRPGETPVSPEPVPEHHEAVHLTSKPMEPEHPMMLDGSIVPGDVELMIRCMLEELLQLGIAPAELREMTCDANYQALYAARRALGDDRLDVILDTTIARIGRHRHREVEHQGSVQPATLTIDRNTIS